MPTVAWTKTRREWPGTGLCTRPAAAGTVGAVSRSWPEPSIAGPPAPIAVVPRTALVHIRALSSGMFYQ
ncbi:MAG TPA: hypothetical protein DHU96_24890 [Actinobacteria bacterium]|nr:hypothetical protein [Actinomycetota bacterium]